MGTFLVMELEYNEDIRIVTKCVWQLGQYGPSSPLTTCERAPSWF